MVISTVILAGGQGCRLWPISRTSKPKQFLSFGEGGSMLQKTYKRNHIDPNQKTYVLTNSEHISLLEEQLNEIGVKNCSLIIEPESKNTAPAIVAAALDLYNKNASALMIVVPSDSEIKGATVYQNKVREAIKLAEQGFFVTFGIKPTRPEVAYGYIKKGGEIGKGAYSVEKFVEKPDLNKAREYLASGDYFWNSGMFVFPVARLLEEMNNFEPKMLKAVQSSLDQAQTDGNKILLAKGPFSQITANSIDYALMEKVNDVAVLESEFYWSDMGTWYSVWETQDKDSNGNVLSKNSIAVNTKNTLVNSSSSKLIATLDIENISIVETRDALLVANTNSSFNIKEIVNELSKKNRPEVNYHAGEERPWGNFTTIIKEKKYLVKNIVVKPKQKLSLQYHNHRSEHWIVVKGTAEVTVGKTVTVVKENEYIFIPKLEKHRLANIGDCDLELVEIQFGDTLDESDIVRIEDMYGRR